MSNHNLTIKNSPGLSIDFLENGSVKSIEASPIRINLKASTLFSEPGTNLYLRKKSGRIEYKALLGPESDSSFAIAGDAFTAKGSWSGLDYSVILQLSKQGLSWQWSIDIRNNSGGPLDVDLIYLQDVGLKPINSGLLNEYYVTQYIERRILHDERLGAVVCCRQNMKESAGYPWLMLACMNGAVAASTDGMQFYGKSCRETGIPEGLLAERLGGEYAGESSVAALQEKPFRLLPGAFHQSVFMATFLPDHPLATTKEDLEKGTPSLLNHPGGPPSPLIPSPLNIFNTSPFLPVEDLNEEELIRFFGHERRHAEQENGKLLSFFSNHNHVVLRSKEILADRPHAHIMQAKSGFIPDESIMSTTSFAFGVFNSHITQGNTNFNVLLSICTSQFNQVLESGQRIFIELNGKRYLLGVPSAFEMGLNHCRWIYKCGEHCFQVRTWTSRLAPQINLDFRVIKGEKVKLLITHDFDPLNGWNLVPDKSARTFIAKPKPGSMVESTFKEARFRLVVHGSVDFKPGGDELLFEDHTHHGSPLFVIEAEPTEAFCMSFTGEVCQPAEVIDISDPDQQWRTDCKVAWTEWRDLSLNLDLRGEHPDIAAIREILPWFGMNALIHFLTPYGLEQFGGAAWGTRDVSQGPVDLLLNLGKYEEARQVLLTIFSNQNPDGGWPQWWMFDSYRNIRSDSSHDDIYYWTMIALAGYVRATGDVKILEEPLSYYASEEPGQSPKTPLSEHIERLIRMIVSSFIPATSLVPFGGGDWNDSLQPVSRELAKRMISSWTVEMNYQAFDQYRWVYEQTGEQQKALELKEVCEKIKSDFNKFLVKDGIVAGYGLVEEDRSISVMLHPSENKTGVRYSILPMERGIISGIFTREQAEFHHGIIEAYLKGPDGARLMDRPLQYRGGIQAIFQRAESSTFFGREIGLMYVHEHIRYAELLARLGRADAFVTALRQAIPVGYCDIVPMGDVRQANCYYSSSDVHFATRYEADERYDEVIKGKLTLRGGWRVYSSGPGIYIGLIVSRLLGLRIQSGHVIIDPVMPYSMNGLDASINFMGHPVTFHYSILEGNFTPKSITINGKAVQFTYEENKYRRGGAVIPVKQYTDLLNKHENLVEIWI